MAHTTKNKNKNTDEASAVSLDVFNKSIAWRSKLILGIGLAVIIFASFALGRFPVDPITLLQTLGAVCANLVLLVLRSFGMSVTLFPLDPDVVTALFCIRFPRIFVVLLSGAALAISGAAYQGMFKNPLVSPDILGASSGAAFGACMALLLDAPQVVVQISAFCGALIAVGIVLWINRLVNAYDALLGLVLGGILVATLFEAGTSLVKYVADASDKLPTITFWLMGSFSRIDQFDFLAVVLPMLFGFCLLLLKSWELNVLSFGEEEAKSLGIHVERVRLYVIFASTLIVACSVAVAGIVGWVGLVIPHLARSIVGANYKSLLPASLILGAGYLLIVDDISRLASTVEVPIGILTALLGVPFFLFIFKRNMQGW